MEPRYQEGYTKGVHDMDGAKILKSLLELHHKIDLLIYSSESRALARLFWKCLAKKDTKDLLRKRLKELSKVSIFFSSSPNLESYIPYVSEKIEQENNKLNLFNKSYINEASEYLCLEIMKGEDFVVSV